MGKKKKKQKAKKPKTGGGGGGGGGVMVEVYKGPSAEDILDQVKGAALDLIGTESLEDDMPLMEAGLDSLAVVEYQSILTKSFEGVNLPATIMFDMPTTKMISEYIAGDLKTKLTVTEMQGGGGGDDEEDDEDDEESTGDGSDDSDSGSDDIGSDDDSDDDADDRIMQ